MDALEIEVVAERIPGLAPVSDHSRWEPVTGATPVPPADVLVEPPWVDPGGLPPLALLDGEWRRRATADDPADPPIGPDVDDRHWDRVMVPDNYGLEPSLSAHFGPVWYRKRLAPLTEDHERCRVVFDAVDYLADVWLDGRHLGHHEGYFAPFAFDVTGRVEAGSVLTVRVQDPFEPLEDDATMFQHAKRVIKGTLKYHDSRPGGLPGARLTPGWTARLGQSRSTGGITGAVYLEGCGPLRIDAVWVTPLDPAAGLVHTAIVVTNVAHKPVDALLQLAVGPTGGDGDEPAAAGELSSRLGPGASRIDARITIADPQLWWPASHVDLGPPFRYSLDVAAVADGKISDRSGADFGLRTARVTSDDDGRATGLEVNGRPVFVQAANYIGRQHFADVGFDFYRQDMALAAAANLNSLGVHAHLQPPDCYDAADDAGILVFQDFPLQWRYDSGQATNPGFVDLARKQIAEMAYTYWNHPSIVYWACHNEPMAMFFPNQDPDSEKDVDNKVLDEALESRLREVEVAGHPGSRHVHRASGIGDDLHMYEGSLAGGDVYRVREHDSWFVSEYGFWTVGENHPAWGDQGWPPDRFAEEEWLSRLSFGPSTMAYAGRPDRYLSADAWREATEAYGAYLAKYQTEWIRMHRGLPFRAYRWHFFVDWWGWAGGGLVDVDRQPKATYRALADASRPLLVATSLPSSVAAPGETLDFPVVAVNERRSPAGRIEVAWRWLAAPASLVIGVDTELPDRYQLMAPPTPGAMVALPYGPEGAGRGLVVPSAPLEDGTEDAGEVLSEGELSGRVGPESMAELGTIQVRAAPEAAAAGGMAAATLELSWVDPQEGETASNWFHVLSAPPDWFCGPGAWLVTESGQTRLGAR